MTKKDYELIAEEFNKLKQFVERHVNTDGEYNKGKYDTWYILANNFCNTLANNNPKFDRNRFLAACGVEV